MTENNATAEFRVEGEPAFPATENKETDNSSGSPTGEKTNTEQTQSQEGEQATADTSKADGADSGEADKLMNHPRWQEREKDWKDRFNDQEKRHQDNLQSLREEFETKYGPKKPAENQSNNSDLPDTPPGWFGGDEAAWKEFKQWNEKQLGTAKDAARKEVLDEMKSKTDAEQKAIKDATDYLNSEVSAIEADKAVNPQSVKIDRNKLFKIVHDMKLVDTEGRWNYRAGFEIYKSQLGAGKGKSDTTDRKAIADATTSDKRSEPATPNVTSSTDFSKPGARPW